MPIIINNVEITDDEVHAEMQHHPAENIDMARHLAAQTLVVKQLFMQEAMKKKIIANVAANDLRNEDIEKAIDELIKQEISIPNADGKTCANYYEQNKNRFVDKTTGKQLPLENVSPLIKEYLHAKSLQVGISQYIKLLARRAKIAGFDMEESDNPLVQ